MGLKFFNEKLPFLVPEVVDSEADKYAFWEAKHYLQCSQEKNFYAMVLSVCLQISIAQRVWNSRLISLLLSKAKSLINE